MQVRVGLISILSKFRVDVSKELTPIPIEPDLKALLLTPKNGMHLKVTLAD